MHIGEPKFIRVVVRQREIGKNSSPNTYEKKQQELQSRFRSSFEKWGGHNFKRKRNTGMKEIGEKLGVGAATRKSAFTAATKWRGGYVQQKRKKTGQACYRVCWRKNKRPKVVDYS